MRFSSTYDNTANAFFFGTRQQASSWYTPFELLHKHKPRLPSEAVNAEAKDKAQ